MKSRHPIPPGGSGLLWMESKARGGGSLSPVMNVGYLVSLSACPCLRLPSCEIKLHTPPSQTVCVRRKASWRGTGRDSCGRSSWRWQHNAGSTFLDGLWVMHREQADSGIVAWRKVFEKGRVNVWQQSLGEQTEHVQLLLGTLEQVVALPWKECKGGEWGHLFRLCIWEKFLGIHFRASETLVPLPFLQVITVMQEAQISFQWASITGYYFSSFPCFSRGVTERWQMVNAAVSHCIPLLCLSAC